MFEQQLADHLSLPLECALSHGWVAEWLCSGLQLRVHRFDSGLSLHLNYTLRVSNHQPKIVLPPLLATRIITQISSRKSWLLVAEAG